MPRNAWSASDASAIRPARARPALAGRRIPAVVWGALFVIGGAAVWLTVPAPEEPLPELWRATADPGAIVADLSAAIRSGPRTGEGEILRLAWPPHPGAVAYELRIRDRSGRAHDPVHLTGPVFVYDLGSDALSLPAEFEWEVAALLADGTRVITPPRSWPGE